MVQADVQKVAIIYVLAADGCFGEVEGWFGHRFGHTCKRTLKMQTGYRQMQGLRIIHARQAVAFEVCGSLIIRTLGVTFSA